MQTFVYYTVFGFVGDYLTYDSGCTAPTICVPNLTNFLMSKDDFNNKVAYVYIDKTWKTEIADPSILPDIDVVKCIYPYYSGDVCVNVKAAFIGEANYKALNLFKDFVYK